MEKITTEDLAMALVKHKMSVKKNFVERLQGYVDLLSKDAKLNSNYQTEYFIFDLFTDLACFTQAFGRTGRHIFDIYSVNVLIQHQGKGLKLDMQKFDSLFAKRLSEYQGFLDEYDPEFMKSIDEDSYLPGLGKAFSIHLVGHKDPAIIMMASFDFVAKLKHLLPYYREIAEEYVVE